MEQSYARFLTPENVKEFALYVFENDLMCDEHFVEFFDELGKNVNKTHTMKKTCALKCLKQFYCMQDECLPECCAKTCVLASLSIMFGFQYLTMCLCFDVEPNHKCDELLRNCVGCLSNTCRFMETCFCCKYCIKTKLQHMQYLHDTQPTLLAIIHNTFMQKNYHEMLLNYPPYVLFCIESQIFSNKWNFTTSHRNEETREQKLSAHKIAKPIDELFDENALFWFILTPEYQTQILSHAMTYGNSCCKFCGIIDLVTPTMRDVIENNYRLHNHVEFMCNGNARYRHIFNNVVFARFLKYQTDLPTVDTQTLHEKLLHIIAYREFLHNFSQMKCRVAYLHEMVIDCFDVQNMGDHVIGNEYLVRVINKFL
jgi:hypothetical protein